MQVARRERTLTTDLTGMHKIMSQGPCKIYGGGWTLSIAVFSFAAVDVVESLFLPFVLFRESKQNDGSQGAEGPLLSKVGVL